MRLGRATLSAGLAGGLAVAACGGRSTLEETLVRAGGGDRPHVPSDPPNEPDEPPEEPDPDPGTEPELPVPCQESTCADDGDACNGIEVCDPDTGLCIHTDAPVCDDGLLCNGAETCEPELGCVSGEPVVCEAAGAFCDENSGRCACEAPFVAPDCQIRTALFAHLGEVRDLAEERGVLWITTSTGLWALDFADTPNDGSDDTWVHFDELIGASDTGTIAIDEQGTKWFSGTYDRQLARLDDGGTPLNQEDDAWYVYGHQDSVSPRALGLDGEGHPWLGGVGETLRFSDAATPEDRTDDVWRSLSDFGAPAALVELSPVDVISNELPGVLWFGSSNGGLFAYDLANQAFADLTHESWAYVHELAWQDGALWLAVGTERSAFGPDQLARVPVSDSVFDVSPDDWEIYPTPNSVDALDVDVAGHIWVGHDPVGLSCLDSGSGAWSAWNTGESAQSILTRSPTDLWFAGDSVFHLDHGGSCSPQTGAVVELANEQALRSPARDVAIEGQGLWLATDGGVDYLDTAGTPFDPADDRWEHFDEQDVEGLGGLQGALVGPDGIKYFWGTSRVFAFDDGSSPFDKSDDGWVGHDTDVLWVSGVVDSEGRLLVVGLGGGETITPRIVTFDPSGTPTDASDDVVTTIESGLPGIGRNMTIDAAGEIWLGTEVDSYLGNLFHWDRAGTPLDGSDDVWTPVRSEDGRVWKLEADPTGGVWGTVTGGVFHFYDGGTPTDLSDDYWHLYTDLGSAMDIGPEGIGWFRMPGGAGILDVGGTPRDPSDDVARVLLSPDALRFQSNLYTNGKVDDEGRFWVVHDYVQVFEYVE